MYNLPFHTNCHCVVLYEALEDIAPRAQVGPDFEYNAYDRLFLGQCGVAEGAYASSREETLRLDS